MRTFHFEKEKYGFELLMDLHKFETNPTIFFEPKPHTTDFFEIFIFEKAKGEIELNGNTFTIGKNTLFFISPYQKKSCEIDITEVKGFHLVFQNDFLSDFFDDKLFVYRLQYFYNSKHPQYLQLEKEAYDKIQFILNEIISEINNFQNDSLHIIRSLLYFSLSKLNRLYCKEYDLSSETQANSVLYKFKEALEIHIRKFHSVEAYCNILNVSRHQLNEIVKIHFGSTSIEIIHFRLLQEIKMELRYSNKTVAEIANELSFSEANNMTRFFNRHENVTPSSYRQYYQNDRYSS
ncbi:helix-turn-helix domain-containing protein [Kordia sp.]|uniref:helix-turn-helix domain-containing protein n=1 Tax=Kordia sp. TaxID=1965332 RepID=UPI003D29A528